MKKNYSIQIPEPCHEDWGKMSPNEKGRFCDSCAKTVVDFTHQKKEDIENYLLLNQDQSVCGRVVNSQIDEVKEMETLKKFRRFAAACFLVFGSSLFSYAFSFTTDEVLLTELLKTNSIISDASDKVEIIHGGMLILPKVKNETIEQKEEVNLVKQGKMIAEPTPPDSTEVIEPEVFEQGEIEILGGMTYFEEPIIEEPFIMGDTILEPEDPEIDTSSVLDLNLILPDEILEQFFEVETLRGQMIIEEVPVENEMLISGNLICIPEDEEFPEIIQSDLIETEIQSIAEKDTSEVDYPLEPKEPEVSDNPKVIVYPNPATDIVSVELTPKLTEKLEIAVFDQEGRIIFTNNIYGRKGEVYRTQFNVSDWEPGTYIVSFKGDTGIYSVKLIVN